MREVFFGVSMHATLLLLTLLPGAVNAHSFTIAVVVPLSGGDAVRGQRVVEGVLLATHERDGHAGEESDGHLGGLDSYVVPVDANLGREYIVARLREMDASRSPSFVTGLFPQYDEDIARIVGETDSAVLVDPARSKAYQRAMRRPDGLDTMSGASFAATYRAAYGQDPDADAVHGYIAARLIDATIRAVQAQLGRREALAAALVEATGKGL